MWTPPADFAQRTARRVAIHDEYVVTVPRIGFWVSAVLQGVVAAVIGYAGSILVSWAATAMSLAGRAAVDGYLRVVLSSNNVQALSLAWTCAALSLLVTFISTRRSLT